LKVVPAKMPTQQVAVEALLSELASIFDIVDLHVAGQLTAQGGERLRQLLAPGCLSRTVEIVRTYYGSIWAQKAHLDDRHFLLPSPLGRVAQFSPSASPCRPTTRLPSSPSGIGRAPLLTPLRGDDPLGRVHAQAPQTPISRQLECVGWLREAVATPVDMSALVRYYDACEQSPEMLIESRLSKLCSRVQSVLLSSNVPTDASEEQVQQVRRLYYKMLLSFLEAEERRLKLVNFSSLLTNASFHTSLAACCFESVFASYSTVGMTFPAVLHYLQLEAFDFDY